MPGTPPVSGETALPDEVTAGLRAANARLRELLAQRDAQAADSIWRAPRRQGWSDARLPNCPR